MEEERRKREEVAQRLAQMEEKVIVGGTNYIDLSEQQVRTPHLPLRVLPTNSEELAKPPKLEGHASPPPPPVPISPFVIFLSGLSPSANAQARQLEQNRIEMERRHREEERLRIQLEKQQEEEVRERRSEEARKKRSARVDVAVVC